MLVVVMLAHAFSGTQPKRTMTFVATGAEEIGCLGAIHYAKKRKEAGTLSNIKFSLNFDSLTYGPNFQLYSTDKELKDMVIGINKQPGMIGTPKCFDQNGTLDGKPFGDAGARALYVNSRGYDWTLPLWHRPEDKPEKVKPELIENSFLVFKEYLSRLQEI
jgi:Zn-dependent M28 family amino/carboxypeptidase